MYEIKIDIPLPSAPARTRSSDFPLRDMSKGSHFEVPAREYLGTAAGSMDELQVGEEATRRIKNRIREWARKNGGSFQAFHERVRKVEQNGPLEIDAGPVSVVRVFCYEEVAAKTE